ncbi:MAG: hypothetical protein AAFY71_28720 [Bacteroidota bacterium]
MDFSDKYNSIRQKFFDKFYYSGHVAESIEGDRIKFADQTIYIGQALIFLASEIYIMRRNGQNLEFSIQKIDELLDTVEQLDRDAEPLYSADSQLNGFILRDNIIGVDDPRLNNRFAQVDSDWQTPENAAPSGDQIFGLFYGLWCVAKLSEEEPLIERAKEISDRIYLFAKNSYFELKLPNGDDVKRGGDMRWLSSLLHGLNKYMTGKDRFEDSKIKLLGFELPLNGVASFWDNSGDEAAVILQTSIDLKFDIPVIGEVSLGEIEVNSFAAHIILMAIAPSDIWTKGEFEAAALSVNHHFSILLYSFASNSTPDSFGLAEIQEILDKCPSDGTQSDLPVETGWQKDNRWIRSRNIDEPGSGSKEYNGVDFLILHNLAEIVFS